MAHFETVMEVGQEFWTIELKHGEKKIVDHRVEEIRIYEGNFIDYVYDLFYDECYSTFSEKDIGKTVFLSEEEAKLVLYKK